MPAEQAGDPERPVGEAVPTGATRAGGADERAKASLRAAGEVRSTPQAPNDRAHGPKSER